jgi:cytochrome P450
MASDDEKGKVKMQQEEIEVIMTLWIFAGDETASSVMSTILTELLSTFTTLQISIYEG